jgi:outer membrane biosynthesis protein TonB
VLLAAPPATAEPADSSDVDAEPEPTVPAAADPEAEPADDGEDPLAEPAPQPAPQPAPAPQPTPTPTKKREPKVDPLGLGLAVGGYALLVVSVGLFAGMGVRLQRGKNANEAITSTTTPDTEEMRINAFANGERANESARNFGIAAGVVLVAGIALVATGHVLMSRRKQKGARAQLTPTVGPHEAGVTWRIAF